MKGRVIRSVSIPFEDLADVDELAEEYGGIGAFFRHCYRAIIDHRLEAGRDPTKAEFAVLVHEKKAAEEARAEELARMRKRRAEEKAEAARKRREIVAEAQRVAEVAKAAPPPAPIVMLPPAPRSRDEHVADRVEWVRHARKQGAPESSVDNALRKYARAHDFEPEDFRRDVLHVVKGQMNLPVSLQEVRS